MAKYEVELSKNCNLNCTHCGMWGKMHHGSINIQAIIRTLQERGDVDSVYIWGGEPLLGNLKDIQKLMDTFPDANYTLSSNLTMPLTQKSLAIIERCNEVVTSFDVGIRFTSWRQILQWYRNVKYIRDCMDTHIDITTVVTKQCAERGAEAFLRLYDKLNVDHYQFTPLMVSGQASRGELPDRDAYQRFMMQVAKHGTERNKTLYFISSGKMYSCMYRSGDVVPINGEGARIQCFVGDENKTCTYEPTCLACGNFMKCGGGLCPYNRMCWYDEAVQRAAQETFRRMRE